MNAWILQCFLMIVPYLVVRGCQIDETTPGFAQIIYHFRLKHIVVLEIRILRRAVVVD